MEGVVSNSDHKTNERKLRREQPVGQVPSLARRQQQLPDKFEVETAEKMAHFVRHQG